MRSEDVKKPPSLSYAGTGYSQWVDLRENLQETIDFPMKYGIFLQLFP